ncbi:MAG TPA: penicillin-binding protein 2 [Gammaproteobacteria bacterium]|jgi:penicillin-binding protein 2|nr:penicillin-binding protein 2 [Gammaproteobacteria bacterium]
MPKRIAIKNHIEEIQLTTRRSIAAFVIMLILISLLILRLAFLQLMQHDLYTTLSKKNWLDIVAIEPTRGLIYDRNGVLLAENIPVFSLDIIPNKITNLTQTLASLSKIIPLSDTEIAQFHKELKQHRRFDEIPLKYRLSETEVAKFYENQYHFPGAVIKARLIRHYPMGGTVSHVLGYVGRINTEDLEDIDITNYSATNYIGKLGIEKFYEDELHGTVGYEQAENDASGQPVRVLNRIKPIPGKNLYLTIDVNLQLAAEEALAGSRGAVVAIQPATGQVLALVSEPTYDPNLFVAGISNQEFQTLQQSQDKPLYNRSLRGLYPLASTIKPFLALEALDSGIIDTRYTIFDPGWYQLPNNSHRFHDFKRHGHGRVNVSQAITSSCDTFFFDLAHRMGIARIDDILTRFGFGELSGIDIGEELPGVVASPAWKRKAQGLPWYEGDTINSGIGQGSMTTTPIQLANGIAIIANRGIRYVPHLLLKEQVGKKVDPQMPITLDPVVMHDDTWNTVIKAMQEVITSQSGTGYRFGKNVGYSVAAKTGTGQVFSIKKRDKNENAVPQMDLPEHLRDHSFFVAFAPVDKPEIAVAVIVENSVLAGSIARKVLDYYLLGPPKPEIPQDNEAGSSRL